MITAKIIKDSFTHHGKRLTTFELEYPRFIHSELMTHRATSKNSSSSRALPHKTMRDAVWNQMALPIHWGKHQSGMQANKELTGIKLFLAKWLVKTSGRMMCLFVWALAKCDLAKQVTNRYIEPWSHIKIVFSATELDNFFYLRHHPDAQPEFYELAKLMYKEYCKSQPRYLAMGEWHLPYLNHIFTQDGQIKYYIPSDVSSKFCEFVSLEDGKKLSASLCAQVSYRKSDMSLNKALKIYNRLVESKPVHASPFEHQATPMEKATDRDANYIGWRQFRSEIPDNVCTRYLSGAGE